MDDATRKIVLLVADLWRGWCDGGMPDGGDFQDMLEQRGITHQVPYDPAVHGEDSDCEPGDDLHFLRPEIRELIDRACDEKNEDAR